MFSCESNPFVDLKCSQAGTFEDKIISLKHIYESLENYYHVMIPHSVISEWFCTVKPAVLQRQHKQPVCGDYFT